MRFTLDPGGDVVVPDGVTLEACRAGLARLAGRTDLQGAVLGVDGRGLPDDHVAGAPPWVEGSVLTPVVDVGPRSPAASRRPADPAAAAARAAWHLAVVAGPRTGEVHVPEPSGTVADLRSLAPSRPVVGHRVRGRHRRWWVEQDGVRRRRLRPGASVVLGRSTLELRLDAGPPAEGRTGGRRRSGRFRALRGALVQPGVLVPMGGAVVLAAVLRSPVLLLMGLVGPLAVLLQRRGDAAAADPRSAGPDDPAPSDGAARGGGGEERTPGPNGPGAHGPGARGARSAGPIRHGPVRPPAPGTALTDPAAAAVRAAATRTAGVPAPAGAEAADGAGQPDRADAVERAPWWRFAADGGLAVVGPAETTAGVVRALLADALTDRTLDLAVLQPPGPSWGWLRWVGARLAGPDGVRVGRTATQAAEVLVACPARVLVLDAHGAARRPALHRWWVRGRSDRAGLLLVETDAADLPAWCPWVLEVGSGTDAVLRGPEGTGVPVVTPVVTEDWAERHARRCAGGRRPTGVGAGPGISPIAAARGGPDGDDPLPSRVSLDDLGLATDRDGILRAWAAPRRRRRLDLALGADAHGTVRADLVREGPHLLVAGTTGAGKSELLQTILLALALTHPPEEVAMVLLDYKGGAGFGRTRDLPHVTGMVTDLDPTTAARALEGLRTELRRREELLAAADAGDVADLPRPPARLVVVVDEFRALVEDLPQFVPALVRLATQGRSLGVHLVLATQRPSGVVDAQLRSNLPLRVCLRVTDPADSRDVVDVPDAAGIAASTPGRAVLSRPGAGADVLQTAWAALPGGTAQPGVGLVRPADPWSTWCPWRHPDVPAVGRVHGDPSPDVVEALVQDVAAAHRSTGRPRPVAPWLPPLPERIGLDEVTGLEGMAGPAVPLAVRDLPDRRARDVVGWDRRNHLAVLGGPGSGRTTALRTLAAGVLAAGGDVHVLTGGSEQQWRDLREDPGLGSVVGPEDPARALALVTALLRPAPPRSIPTVLCVDDAAGVVRSLDLLPRAPGADLLDRLLRESRGCGVVVAVSSLPGEAHRLLRHVGERLVLRVDDVHDALGLGVPRTLWTPGAPPGRGVHLPPAGRPPAEAGADPSGGGRPSANGHRGDGHPANGHRAVGPRACQVLLPPVAAADRGGAVAPSEAPLRLVALPESVRLPGPGSGGGPGGPHDGPRGVADEPLLGVGGDDAGPVRVPLAPAVLVVGPAASGRTTTLRTLAHGLRGVGRRVVDDPADVVALIDALTPGAGVVVVDDVELLVRRRPAAEERLAAWVEAAEEGSPDVPRVVVAARTDRVASAYRGLLATLRSTANLVLLAPGSPGSADVAGVDLTPALDPLQPLRPGRGALVRGGRVTRVQVAVP